jgi:hypothetical protein
MPSRASFTAENTSPAMTKAAPERLADRYERKTRLQAGFS